MSTLRTLIENTRHALSGYDATRDSVGALTLPLDSSSLTFATDGTDLSVGLAEIDLELVRVKAVDAGTGSLTLYGFGRGYRGTVAAAHAAGAEVTFNPTWPRVTVARVINEVIQSLYPRIYVVAEATVQADQFGRLVVPVDAIGVLSLFSQSPIDDQWTRPNRWEFDPHAGAGDHRTLRVSDYSQGTYRLVYAKRPKTFDLSNGVDQDFESVTGLDDSLEGLLALGVAARLAPFIDVARLPGLAAEARLEGNSHSDAAATTRLLSALFQQAVAEEAAVLNRDHPIKAHRTVI